VKMAIKLQGFIKGGGGILDQMSDSFWRRILLHGVRYLLSAVVPERYILMHETLYTSGSMVTCCEILGPPTGPPIRS
jgi:hypothetical protein